MLLLTAPIYLAFLVAPARASMCSDAEGMTDELRKIFVDKHNEYRTMIAKGQAVDKIGGYAPKAARLLKMSYDCAIEANTMEYVKKCYFAHDSYKERNHWGQSIWEVEIPNYNKTVSAAWAVDWWFGELEEYGVPQDNILTGSILGKVGHYSQLAWQWTYKIGCAVQWCSDMTFVACEYDPAGNVLGNLIYEIGDPCKTNDDCKCTGCICSREEALCIPPSTTTTHSETSTPKLPEKNKPETRNPGKPAEKDTKKPAEKDAKDTRERKEVAGNTNEKHTEKPAPMPGPVTVHCPLDNGMTDEARQMFLDKHNGYRSLVAKGEAKDGLGGFAPKAARLTKMSYDCDVENSVMNWIKKCKYESSPWDDRLGLGENLWMTTRTKMDKISAADESTSSWFSALAKYGVGQKNIFTREAYLNGVGNYTQMVWQSTLKLGCGAEWCDGMTLVGCHYERSGNFVGGLIYEVGDPCKTDADCMCTGCTCVRDEALCIVP